MTGQYSIEGNYIKVLRESGVGGPLVKIDTITNRYEAVAMLCRANSQSKLLEVLRKVESQHRYTTPAGTENCRFCDSNLDHEGTYEDMHTADCVIREIRAAIAAAAPEKRE